MLYDARSPHRRNIRLPSCRSQRLQESRVEAAAMPPNGQHAISMPSEIRRTSPDGVPKVGEAVAEIFLNRWEKLSRNSRGESFNSGTTDARI